MHKKGLNEPSHQARDTRSEDAKDKKIKNEENTLPSGLLTGKLSLRTEEMVDWEEPGRSKFAMPFLKPTAGD